MWSCLRICRLPRGSSPPRWGWTACTQEVSASSGVFSCRSPCPVRIPSQRTPRTSRWDRPIRFWSRAAFLSFKISNESPLLSLPSASPGSRNVLVSSSTSPSPGLYCGRCGNERLRQMVITGHIEGGLKKKSSEGIKSHGISSRAAAACVRRPLLLLCIIAPIYSRGGIWLARLDKPSWCYPTKKFLKDFFHLRVSLCCGEEGLFHGKTSIINRLFSPSHFSDFTGKAGALARCWARIWSSVVSWSDFSMCAVIELRLG